MLQLTSLYICYWKIAKRAFLEIDILSLFFFFVKITFILWYHGDIDNCSIRRKNCLGISLYKVHNLCWFTNICEFIELDYS